MTVGGWVVQCRGKSMYITQWTTHQLIRHMIPSQSPAHAKSKDICAIDVFTVAMLDHGWRCGREKGRTWHDTSTLYYVIITSKLLQSPPHHPDPESDSIDRPNQKKQLSVPVFQMLSFLVQLTVKVRHVDSANNMSRTRPGQPDFGNHLEWSFSDIAVFYFLQCNSNNTFGVQ